ncbi:MAG: excinuclease ABC subunit UvrC [Verrucomicrobia bacterium]|nr:excinuclease ABC subunit UvrC [Verrucomicrobiota bacterium]
MSFQREKTDLQKKLHDVPHTPGVYIMRDRLNRVIYVGKARDLRKRLSSYFMPSRARKADIKTRALIDSIWDFDTHDVRNDAEALILEMRLIKDFRPKYNISFKDDKRYLLVKVQMADPLPRFTLTRMKKDDGARYFGPYAHSSALRTTLNWMNRNFGLRVCRPLQPDENDYKHCHNDIIKNCSAPCVARVTQEEYRERIDRACEFLGGKSRDLITALETEMQKVAARLDFERAAELRDMIEDFKTTLKPTRSFERGASMRVASTINPEADLAELQEVLKLDRPPRVMECFDIANIGEAHCVASMVRFKNGVPDNANYRRYRIKIVSGQNDFASMSEVVRRRYSRILLEARAQISDEDADLTQENPLEAMRRLEESENPKSKIQNPKFVRLPDLVIVDGGKGQLSAAMKELQRLGLHELPIIGLAKEHEEIFRPGRSEPIVLNHETGALKLLQRIRDEAHRWANGYHQLLLQRRVQESILDDCPGVSKTRKAALLREFGSVSRLRRASAEEIGAVPGIGKSLGEQITTFLRERSN